jgi:excinuclease UvrABC helicase subunit UvrB
MCLLEYFLSSQNAYQPRLQYIPPKSRYITHAVELDLRSRVQISRSTSFHCLDTREMTVISHVNKLTLVY